VLNAGDLSPATKTRISGANRSATAKAVATQTNTAGSYTILAGAKEIFVANEASFADAMAIAPYAFNASAPVILTGKDSLGADALAVLKVYKALGGTKIKILGGTAAVSDQVIQDIVISGAIPLSSISRIFGADRYATSVAIQNYVDASSVNAANFDASHVVMVNGQNFADGLAAAPYAGFGTGGAARLMYLTEAGAISAGVSAKMTTHSKSDFPTNVYAVGGTAAVSADVISGVTTAAQAYNTTSTLTCVENSTATSVTLTVPGNISAAAVGAETYLGDEGALILNGALTINGTSNTSNASTPMVDTYSVVTGNTTLVGLVPAGTLTKGYVITWSGLSELANAGVAKRTIAGSTCTVADDKVGPVPTVSAQVGASEFYVTFSEKTTEFDCSDLNMTLAGKVATAYVGCTITGPDVTGLTYKVKVFNDMNANNSQEAATGASLGTVTISSNVITRASHGLAVGDAVAITTTAGGGDDGTFYVRATSVAANTLTVSAAHTILGTGTVETLADQGGAAGSIARVAEAAIVIAAGDVIEVKPQLATAVEVDGVAAVSTAGLLGGTFTTTAHTLSVGDIFAYRGAENAANNGSYHVVSTSGATNIGVRKSAALTADGNVAGQRVNDNVVYDLSENAGLATLTKTLNAVNDADVAKPVLSTTVTCTQGADATLSNGTTVKAVVTNVYGPQGVAGNTYKMYVVNSRGISLPTVVVDATAATITITADLAYTSISDVQAAYANTGGIAWSFAFAASPATALTAIGTASATTAATPITSAGGSTGDVVGAQSCAVRVDSTERLQAIAADAVTAVAAVNGVATAFTASPGTSDVLSTVYGWTRITFTEKFDAWTLPIVDGTVTITLTSALIKDAKGNTVTTLALVD